MSGSGKKKPSRDCSALAAASKGLNRYEAMGIPAHLLAKDITTYVAENMKHIVADNLANFESQEMSLVKELTQDVATIKQDLEALGGTDELVLAVEELRGTKDSLKIDVSGIVKECMTDFIQDFKQSLGKDIMIYVMDNISDCIKDLVKENFEALAATMRTGTGVGQSIAPDTQTLDKSAIVDIVKEQLDALAATQSAGGSTTVTVDNMDISDAGAMQDSPADIALGTDNSVKGSRSQSSRKRDLASDEEHTQEWSIKKGKGKKPRKSVDNLNISSDVNVGASTSTANVPVKNVNNSRAPAGKPNRAVSKPVDGKREYVPPIVVETKGKTLKTIIDTVTSHIGKGTFTVQGGRRDTAQIRCRDAVTYKKLVEAIKVGGELQVHYHQLKSEKQLKYVIRNFDISISNDECIDMLKQSNYFPEKVVRLHKASGNIAMPLMLVIFPNNDHNRTFPQVKHIGPLSVAVEVFRGGKRPIQCFNCLLFGHTAHGCTRLSRCNVCSLDHASRDCPNKRGVDPPKCFRCGGQHPSNYTKCPKYPATSHRSKNVISSKVTPGKSYAAAVSASSHASKSSLSVADLQAFGQQINQMLNVYKDMCKSFSQVSGFLQPTN